MKRKILAMFLATAMTMGLLAGCGGQSAGDSQEKAPAAEQDATSDESSSPEESGQEEGGQEESSDPAGGDDIAGADVNDDGTVNNPEEVKVANKLMLWSLFTGGDGEFLDQIISDYNGTNPTKDVTSITLVWDDYYTKLQTSIATGKGPDIGISHASKLPELVEQGAIEPIDSYLEELGVNLTSMYADNTLESITFDGQVYAIPLDTHAEIIYYNKDILEKAGIELNAEGKLDINSKDDFTAILEKCKAVMEEGESVIAFTSQADDPYRIWWATYFQMNGTPIVNDEGTEVTLDKEIAVKAAEYVKSLYDDGYVLTGIEDHQQFFQSGKAAFYIGGTWATGVLEQTDGLNFGAQPWPQLFENPSCWADSSTIIVPVSPERSDEDTKAVVEFMMYTAKDGGITWAGSGQIPSNQEVRASQEYLDLPYRSSYMEALETGVLPAKNPHFFAMKAGMIESLDMLWAGTADAEAAIDALWSQLEENLE